MGKVVTKFRKNRNYEHEDDFDFSFNNKKDKKREIQKKRRMKYTDDESYDYNDLNEIKTCIIQPQNKCEKNRPLCKLINDGKTCQLILPKYNLLNGANNEKNYFIKMADEIIRYNRKKSY